MTRSSGGCALDDPCTEHETLQQRIASEPVSSVNSSARDFATRIESRHIGLAPKIGSHPTHQIVRGGRDRQRIGAHIESGSPAERINRRETPPDKIFSQMAQVEEGVSRSAPPHLGDNGSRDDISRRKLAARINVEHKPLALGTSKVGAFAAHCLGDQESRKTRDRQLGWVKLLKL